MDTPTRRVLLATLLLAALFALAYELRVLGVSEDVGCIALLGAVLAAVFLWKPLDRLSQSQIERLKAEKESLERQEHKAKATAERLFPDLQAIVRWLGSNGRFQEDSPRELSIVDTNIGFDVLEKSETVLSLSRDVHRW